MNFEDVEKFIKLAKDEGVNELKYDDGKKKFHVVLGGTRQEVITATPQPKVEHHTVVTKKPSATKEEGVVEITSPFVGTFYAQPNPDSSPYTQVGDKVSKGKVLCIVEAMKIMNEIESEVSGTVLEVCVENENYVEYGQVLFKIKV
ncbi:MAG: acetyl-CoA carboxylase biotin carboxyl carrier protein [Bacteriovoracaceae bacterium]